MSLEERIKAIPNDGKFWKVSSESTFLKATSQLSEKGMDGDEIVELLTSLYLAVAHEFGG